MVTRSGAGVKCVGACDAIKSPSLMEAKMRKIVWPLAIIALSFAAALTPSMMVGTAQAGDAYNFVKEYVRQLAAFEAIRDHAEKELAQSQSGAASQMLTCIRSGQLYQLELNTDIAQLGEVKLGNPVEKLPTILVQLYQQKLEQHRQMAELCATMIAGPKPGVDYGEIVAAMPKITANIEYLDHTMFDASPMVFAALIDQRPDRENHLSHLVISKAERDALVLQLALSFGKKMDQDDQNWGVSTASVLRDYLTKKGYKFADDPW